MSIFHNSPSTAYSSTHYSQCSQSCCAKYHESQYTEVIILRQQVRILKEEKKDLQGKMELLRYRVEKYQMIVDYTVFKKFQQVKLLHESVNCHSLETRTIETSLYRELWFRCNQLIEQTFHKYLCCFLESVRNLQFQAKLRIGELQSQAVKDRREGMKIPKELKQIRQKNLSEMKTKLTFILRLQQEICGVIQTGIYQCRSKGSNLRTNLE